MANYDWYQNIINLATGIARVETRQHYASAVETILDNFKAEEKLDILPTFIRARDTSITTYITPMLSAISAMQSLIQNMTQMTVQDFTDTENIQISAEFAAISTDLGYPLEATPPPTPPPLPTSE